MLRKELPENLLEEAVEKACETESAVFNQMAENAKKHRFSRRFQRNIRKQIKQLEQLEEAEQTYYPPQKEVDGIITYPRKRRSLRPRVRVALIAIIIMLMGSMTVFAVEPIREKVYEIVERLFSDHTDVSFEEIEDGQGIETVEESEEERTFNPADFPKKLKWVPEGFELDSEDIDIDVYSCYQWYSNQKKGEKCRQIDYSQSAIDNSGGMAVTSDGTPAEDITVMGETGKLIED